MNSALNTLLPLINQKSNITDPAKFHSAINVVFHDYEAKHYDYIHSEMWQSLPRQYKLLIDDISTHLVNKTSLKLLDVGCGTGLATKMLLDTPLSDRVEDICLLDTSSIMLKKAAKRLKRWSDKIRFIHGDISMLNDRYDFIVISSVLHHIPDFKSFLRKLSSLQNKGGIILTIHDPCNEALQSDVYKERFLQFQDHNKGHPHIITLKGRILNKIKRTMRPLNYIHLINNELIKKQVIKEPLTAAELWSVTDIHVEGLPYSANDGISLSCLLDTLSAYELLSYRTYAFFGTLISNLPDDYKKQEQQLSHAADKHGRNFASVWIKN